MRSVFFLFVCFFCFFFWEGGFWTTPYASRDVERWHLITLVRHEAFPSNSRFVYRTVNGIRVSFARSVPTARFITFQFLSLSLSLSLFLVFKEFPTQLGLSDLDFLSFFFYLVFYFGISWAVSDLFFFVSISDWFFFHSSFSFFLFFWGGRGQR